MTLSSLGWDDFFANAFQPYSSNGLVPARVACEHKHAYDLLGADGELAGVCTGRLLHLAAESAELPAVGDWVAVCPRPTPGPDGVPTADIHFVLPRRTCFSRAAAGAPGREQVLAANIDTVFLVMGLDANFNLRRIERYLAVARAGGAEPVVVLTKADLHPAPAEAAAEVRSIVRTVPVVTLSAVENAGLDGLSPWLLPGATIALLGSSGVGKSTLINRLLDEEVLATGAISTAVNKGRHTTTRREMLPLPGGALVIDTPGLRELQLWDVSEDTLAESFDDVAAVIAQCRFHDCTHGGEPGCAVVAALESGELDETRWASYQKLRREQAYAARRADPQLAREHRDRWKKIYKDHRQRTRLEERSE
ncbi:ribosome small subunit-dependent GTPase A [Opitutus sp. ER46]|uniref:ribosome small subunit-dependent GTPase A n=1 Tax=Opitutus sp. ER46 TaxID=2161864 RepID=UPI000D314A6D|nr:ribosome small subunit-dependent GTPase A [Opitutus sp. ER46]PTX97918.1 ribosome small subunit-dependent GTPase A [Opitutus sp. ER46]